MRWYGTFIKNRSGHIQVTTSTRETWHNRPQDGTKLIFERRATEDKKITSSFNKAHMSFHTSTDNKYIQFTS